MNYNLNNNVNNSGYNASYVPNTNLFDEEMSEERRLYLLEKENMLKKRKRNKKRTFLVMGLFLLFVGIIYLYNNYFKSVKVDSRIDKNSIHYVTDLYYSDGRYYEKYLDEKQKKMYIAFLKDLKNLKKSSSFDCRDFGYENKGTCAGYIELIFDVILMEHPDLFWYRTSDYSYREDSNVEINHHYVSTNKLRLHFVEKRLLIKIDELANEFKDEVSDKDKARAIYTWLGKTTHYSNIMTRKSGTAWSALLSDDSVCAGFAAASQLLFQRLGIDSELIVGNYDGMLHAWNFVKLDDGYYWYDSTVAGGVSSDSAYFYNGLFFGNISQYTPLVINVNEYQFGSKYLES